jgi:translation initiation factor 1A
MPQSKGKGGKNRRRGKNESEADKRELVFKEEGQREWRRCLHSKADLADAVCTEYAQVLKMLGNGRLEAQCFDGEKRLAHIRGKLRKKVSLLFLSLMLQGS